MKIGHGQIFHTRYLKYHAVCHRWIYGWTLFTTDDANTRTKECLYNMVAYYREGKCIVATTAHHHILDIAQVSFWLSVCCISLLYNHLCQLILKSKGSLRFRLRHARNSYLYFHTSSTVQEALCLSVHAHRLIQCIHFSTLTFNLYSDAWKSRAHGNTVYSPALSVLRMWFSFRIEALCHVSDGHTN